MDYQRQPFEISDNEIKKAIEHAKQEKFNRSFGYFHSEHGYIPSNLSGENLKHDEILLEMLDFGLKREDIDACVYSIVNYANFPSINKMALQQKLGMPFGAICLDQDLEMIDCFFWGTDNMPKLIGRRFRYGVMDCYALIRDCFKLWFNISLADFPRNDKHAIGEKSFVDCLKNIGFVEVSGELQPGDIICGGIGSKGFSNHGAIVIDEKRVLHHFGGVKSELTDNPRWFRVLKTKLRYKDFIDVVPIIPPIEG